ncbi:MAG: nitroreductase family protein [Rubrivivax sp.]
MTTHTRLPDHPIDPMFTDRWSPRALTAEPIPEATLMALLEAAHWAPSSFNSQPWRFIWARRDTPAWAPLFETLNPVNQSWAQRASALVLMVSRTQWVPPGKTEPAALGAHAFDTGAAWASLAFQAHLSGWQTHAIGGFDRDRARANLGIPADCAVHAVVAIGRRGDPAVLTDEQRAREQPNARHPLSTLAAEGRYTFD